MPLRQRVGDRALLIKRSAGRFLSASPGLIKLMAQYVWRVVYLIAVPSSLYIETRPYFSSDLPQRNFIIPAGLIPPRNRVYHTNPVSIGIFLKP
jgi:hypothetical protein